MRRDTIARRYRLSRCDLCEIETQKAPQDGTVQLQKSRQRRNGKKNNSQSAQSCSSSDSAVSTQQCFLSHPEFQQPLPNFLATSGGYMPQNPVVMNCNEGTMFDLMNGDGQNGLPSKRFHIGGDGNPVLPLVGRTLGATQVFQEQRETIMNGAGARKDSMCQFEPKDTMTFMKKELFDEHEITDDSNKEPEHLIREDDHQLRNYKRRSSEGNKLISEMIKAKMTGHYGYSVKGDPLKCAKQDDSNKIIKKKTHEDGNDELTFHSL
ncbi:unnamed protein product [Cylicostephanus goldi]|uniref:Uncharacterized protein n=1 Tax=Cylicostephanus goldi TaxID=71465 RepID=A0A3P6S8B7_CYLGO|nr:unnamed protein product [Cylicostephanus goldi]